MSDENWTDDGQDLSYEGVNDGPPPPLEGGIYACRIVKAVAGDTNKEPKRPKLDLELKILHKYGEEDRKLGRKVFATLLFTQETAFRVLNAARAAGVDAPTKKSKESREAFGAELIAAGPVFCKLKQDKDLKGNTVAKLDYFLREEQIQSALNGTLGQEASQGTGQRRGRR